MNKKKTKKTASTASRSASTAIKELSPAVSTVKPEAKFVLNTRFISYSTPLEIARGWGREKANDKRKQALVLLQGLFEQYPHAVEIAEELALAYLEANDDKKALAVLDEIQILIRNPHEELLARRGRIFRDKGDHFVKYPVYKGPPKVKVGGEIEQPAEALRYYKLALDQYTQSYQIRFGHYPGVNVATLNLLVAAFSPDSNVRQTNREKCKSIAKDLFSRRGQWPHEHADDYVWHAASRGEIWLLQEDWEAAEKNYREAQNNEHCKAFHRISMLKQVIRITFCYKQLGVASLGPFEDLTKVFPPESEESDIAK